jgi:hypothetical protein
MDISLHQTGPANDQDLIFVTIIYFQIANDAHYPRWEREINEVTLTPGLGFLAELV